METIRHFYSNSDGVRGSGHCSGDENEKDRTRTYCTTKRSNEFASLEELKIFIIARIRSSSPAILSSGERYQRDRRSDTVLLLNGTPITSSGSRYRHIGRSANFFFFFHFRIFYPRSSLLCLAIKINASRNEGRCLVSCATARTTQRFTPRK